MKVERSLKHGHVVVNESNGQVEILVYPTKTDLVMRRIDFPVELLEGLTLCLDDLKRDLDRRRRG